MISVLVVEDTLEVRDIVSYHLEEMGCKVSVCCNAKDAVEKARMRQFNLILMDLRLPDLCGIQATRMIRAFSAVPVVGWSADVSSAQEEEGLGAGMSVVREKSLLKADIELLVQEFAR